MYYKTFMEQKLMRMSHTYICTKNKNGIILYIYTVNIRVHIHTIAYLKQVLTVSELKQ